MRSAIESPMPAPSRTKNSAARCTPRSSSSISRSTSRWRLASGTVSIALLSPIRTGAAAMMYGTVPIWSSLTKLGSRSSTIAR